MKQTHPDIANKEFDYVNLDESIFAFAATACNGVPAEELLESLERAIAMNHGEAVQRPLADHPRMIWELETDELIFQYQVLADRVEIGSIISKTTGTPYEPCHDLTAEYAR